MRDVPVMWTKWKSGAYVGEARPSTRVTVERGWTLHATDAVLGTWNRGPARWYQAADNNQIETEIPNVISVNSNRSDTDVGTCEIVVRNTRPPIYGEPESPAGQYGTIGYYTWDHGVAQDAKARWGQVRNAWNEVLVPNALIRTYVGYGGNEKTVTEALDDGNVILHGVWLVDDVNVTTEGTLSIKCRDMGKLLLDQQLFPPLVPAHLYPLDYHRWEYKTVEIPGDPTPATGAYCFPCSYWHSSTDEYYGQWNTGATGHPGSDAFDISPEPGPDVPGAYAHQRTYWLSEPKDDPGDTVWIEFNVNGGAAGLINQVYYHAWKGAIEGRGTHRVMVSVFEHGAWVGAENDQGGITPQGLPYVSTFTPGTEINPATATNLYALPRDYQANRIRLTVTNLIWADDFPYGYGDPDYHGGGYRGGARKIMACFSQTVHDTRIPVLAYTSAAIPVNDDNRLGYWQVRANGQVFAFGDARVYPPNSPASSPASIVIGMAAHPDGNGYWLVDTTGRVISAGSATHHGDLSDAGIDDVVDIAPAPGGDGYILLRNGGEVYTYGSGLAHHGDGSPTGTMPSGAAVLARSIETHPSTDGYWILWTSGTVEAFNLSHYGNANRDGFTTAEYVASIRRTSTGAGYWITSGSGKVQAFGDAPHKGNAEATGYEAERWYKGICWDLIPSSQGNDGYAVQSADGKLWVRGDATGLNFGSIGTGKAQQRFDGNYKDYADIIRDLVLWSGFYLYRSPQPTSQKPDVYGNIETTGAYADDPLPKSMFDKKPVMDAINEIKQIVGYITYVDVEGGFRFESPNWWGIGNFLLDGTPYPHIPEVDERVQLTNHSVTRSANQARSRIIISSADPYPAVPGQQLPKGIVTTEIVPKTAEDLRGLIVPAMWINGKFLRPDEQKIMADLIDMRMWFSRRTASVTCVANPLLDINDQIRVIERQTGEVYIHYIRGINFSHDLTTGDFKMTLNTYWLGGSPWGKFSIFYTGAMRPQGDGYWTVTLGGSDRNAVSGVYAFGAAELYDRNETDSHLEFIMAMRSTPTGMGYYTMDESGKVLTYGDAINRGDINRGVKDPNDNRRCKDVIDMALTPSGAGYWLLQKDGTITAFGDAVHHGNANPTGNLPSGAEVFAIAIESHPSTMGYWALWTDGTVEAFNLSHHGNANRDGFTSHDHTPCLRRTPTGSGYYIISGAGIVQIFGDATWHGNLPTETVEGTWYYRITWEILVDPDGDGYGLLRADSTIEPFNFTVHSSNETVPETLLWALVSPDEYALASDQASVFGVSREVMGFLAKTGSPSANNAVVNNFAAPSEAAIAGTP